MANTLNNLGNVLRDLGRYDEARINQERALAIREKALGPNHPRVANSEHSLGNTIKAQGKYAEARPHYERALAIWEKTVGPGHPSVAFALTGLAETLLALGKSDQALAAAERAVQIRSTGTIPVEELGQSRFILAQVLWARGRERPRALELARQARDGFTAAGDGSKKGLVEVETWLRAH